MDSQRMNYYCKDEWIAEECMDNLSEDEWIDKEWMDDHCEYE